MSVKQECEELMNELLPFAKRMLDEYREFHPFGGTLSSWGEIVHVGASIDDQDFSSGTTLRDVMKKSFRDDADVGKFRAAAIVCDVRVQAPGEPDVRDAIQVEIDHRDGYSAVVFFPYTFSAAGVLSVEPPFASKGTNRIFVPQ
jgi:hypothetical protein